MLVIPNLSGCLIYDACKKTRQGGAIEPILYKGQGL